jgi:DNA mismatch endonuclease (patch repair protein)
MDNKTKEQRSKNMTAVKVKNTKPEVLVRKALFRQGFRYRLNVKDLPGSPDIVLPKYQTVIFINGCFWHGHHNCKKADLPETNTNFWKKKIEDTKVRDKRKQKQRRSLGWHCFTCWECYIVHERYSFVLDDNRLKINILKKRSRS